MEYHRSMIENASVRKVVVVGAGAIGQLIGDGVAGTDRPLLLVDVDPALVGRLNDEGSRLERNGRDHRVSVEAATSVAGMAPAAIVFFCVKTYATAAAAELVSAIVDEETIVCSLQNGWGNGDMLAERFAARQIVIGVTYNSATVADGTVRHTGVGKTLVGRFAGADTHHAERVAETLRDAGLEAEALSSVGAEIWKKLVLNAATLPTAALTGMSAGQLAADARMTVLVDEVAREAVAVAGSLGYAIDADERIALIRTVLERVGPGKGSMLQDLEASRRTEIDAITGAIVQAAAASGVPVPLHQALYALVRGLEHTRGLA
jgi:2-dehydropantoate 2-reductase